MDNLTLIESFSEFKDDKLIDRVTLMALLIQTKGILKYGGIESLLKIIKLKMTILK